MKKISIGIFLFLILIPFVSSLEVKRVIPNSAAPGQIVDVVLDIEGIQVGKIFTLQDKITPAINIEEWDIVGAKESKENIDYKIDRNGWSFTADSAVLKISYKIKIPASVSQNYEFEGTWFSPEGHGYEKSVLEIKTNGEVAQVVQDTQSNSSNGKETNFITGAIAGWNKGNNKWWIIIPGAIAAIILALTIVSKNVSVHPKKKKKKIKPQSNGYKQKSQNDEYKQNLIAYVKEAINKGREEQEIEHSLINVGWPVELVKKVVRAVAEHSKRVARSVKKVRSEYFINKSLKYHKKSVSHFEAGNTEKSKYYDLKAKEFRQRSIWT